MTDLDKTVVLPKQPSAPAIEEEPRPDPWLEEHEIARGSAPVGGLGGTEAALTRLSWLLTVVVVAAVALVRAGWSSLSASELATWGMANTSWEGLWALRTEIDAFSAPYYVLIRAWADVFGTSEFSLRLPSLIAMVLAAGASSALVSRLVDPRAGILAGLMFAAVPATSRYAHEAGPEALALAFAVLATVALVRLFERPRFWRWVAYTGAVVLLGLTHGAALLLLLGHAGAVLALRRRIFLAWIPAAVLGALPVAGLLYIGRRPWSFPSWVEPPRIPSASLAVSTMFGLTLIGGVIVGLALIGISLKKPAGLFATAAVLPLAGLIPATHFTSMSVSKLVVFSLPFWLCLAAMALHRAPLVRGIVVICLVGLMGLPTQLDIRSADGHGLAARDLADVLNARVQSGDAIVYGPTRTDESIGRDLVARYVADDSRPADLLALNPPRSGGQLYAEECLQVADCLAGATRVWLFRADQESEPLDGLVAAKDGALRVRYELTRTWIFRGASLSLFALVPLDLDRPAPR